ncbi:FAD dependent oxidoreductase [Eremomyces bilateralis CBS 781.70]|uniref:FAD dependent oxidoreductase n=1 Tax=Eremomyces bilateralis CBS 781.70 TaxID=1392243 RepID=A0A6G1GBC2_9PEZI|nr:FAD dependent oxidoreductase [Eremomyces bilateralis CBS 781.70]KAF1815149.1 FAD dependent oxidoreductase [Eremomyces bilateralis CBS 781.70]
MSEPFIAPQSVLIIGSGVFGLSTALSLCERDEFSKSTITLVDKHEFPTPDGASIDTSRLIRADYADPDYAAFATEAQTHWRQSHADASRYYECGLVLTCVPSNVDYLHRSLANLQAMGHSDGLHILPTRADILRLSGTPGTAGTAGYVNRRSGWADAEASMAYLRRQVEATGRVTFVVGTVARLSSTAAPFPQITGAHLRDGRQLTADLTILAAGAWTNALLRLGNRVRATGQVMGYYALSAAEAEALAKIPAQIDMSRGLFLIPPPPPPYATGVDEGYPNAHRVRHPHLKVARHGVGYMNWVARDAGLGGMEEWDETGTEGEGKVSVPVTDGHTVTLPAEADEALRGYIRELFPPNIPSPLPASLRDLPTRPFSHSRVCTYADTPDSSFLVSYHPRYGGSLFLATGGSGHAFKFLPVLGGKVVDVLVGREERVGRLAEKWRWRWGKGNVLEDEWIEEGMRGGVKGLTWDEAVAQSAVI